MCCVRRLLALVVTGRTLKTTKHSINYKRKTKHAKTTKCTKGFTTLSPLAGSVLDPPSAIAGLGAAYVRDARLQNLVDQRRSGTSVAEGAGSGTAKAVQGGPRPSKQAQGGPGPAGPFGRAAVRRAAEARATVAGPAQGEDRTCELVSSRLSGIC